MPESNNSPLAGLAPGGANAPTGPFANEDGYDLWLRYPLVWDAARLAEYQSAIRSLVTPADTPTLGVAVAELERGLGGLLGAPLARSAQLEKDIVTAAAPAWAGSGGNAIDVSADASWRNYRYKVFETVVPLRNVAWLGVQAGC